VRWLRWSLYALLVAGIIAMAVFVLMPQPVAADLATVVRGPFEQTVDDDGKTRVREHYRVSAPLAGTVLRIGLKAGEPVEVGSLLATTVPNPSPMLEPRTRQELEQRLGAAEARKMHAAAAVERARATLDQARADLEGTRALAGKGDVLSTGAVQIEPGSPVHIDGWAAMSRSTARSGGSNPPLSTRCRRWASRSSALGDSYRVDAHIVVYQADNALIVPTGALFRDGEHWAVYVASHGVARKRVIIVSWRAGLEAAVAGGLEPGEQAILFPSDAIRDGVGVVGR
jgi:multidrug efflux pump subunit AcrA (membrane-fusion protein)